jgi:predicted GNAT family N-acyltransferase
LPEDSPSKFTAEPFDKKKHDREAFSCEHEALNRYIKRQAGQDIKKRVAAVFVLTTDGRTIAGYYTLSQYAVDSSSIPEETMQKLGLPKYKELPATLLGRLARSLACKGQGVGELVLMNALKQALDHRQRIASMAVVVDAKDEAAANFYREYGFVGLPHHPNRLFLPMKTVERMFG